MTRRKLSDDQWRRLAPLLPAERDRPGRPYLSGHRATVEAILWIARTGAAWRDLPDEFGKWATVYRRFRRWAEAGVFDRILRSLAAELDLSVAMVDGVFVKVHQYGTGAPKEAARPPSPDACSASVPQRAG